MQLTESRLRSAASALLGVVAVALVCYRIHVGSTLAAIALLLALLIAGAYTRFPEAAIASLAATFCLDYFFLPPIGSISIADPQGWVALIVFLGAALMASNFANRSRRQRDQLMSHQKQAEKLHALNRAMLFSDQQDMRRLVVNKCMELFGFNEVTLFESSTGQFYRSSATVAIPDDALRRAAVYGTVDQSAAKGLTIVPVTLGNKSFGSLGFCGAALPEPTLQALGNTIALGLAQAEAQQAASRAEAVRKSEELKSTMLDALAHDLKTPLTAIEAAADTLLKPTGVTPEQRHELIEIVQGEAQGLRQMVHEAIHLARIDANRLKLNRQPISVAELVDGAIRALGERSTSHRIDVEMSEHLPLVFADKELIVQAVKQLLDNAVKYSPPGSRVGVSAEADNELVFISVHDQGPGLTELEQRCVFNKFYRGRYDRSAVQGTGMGLAIAREILEAHGGSAAVESQVGQGSRFTIALHAAGQFVEIGHQHT